MSKYEELLSLKKNIRFLKAQLAALKAKEPTYENGKRVAETEDEIAKIQAFIRIKSSQYGFVA